jgi:mRNA-degrading endonuclease RelE of RelBE toxin-antitoxin system
MHINYSYKAVVQLEALSTINQKRIADKMRFYAQQTDVFVFAKYIAIRGEYRLRVGNYRIYFEVKNDVLNVKTIERRDKTYD